MRIALGETDIFGSLLGGAGFGFFQCPHGTWCARPPAGETQGLSIALVAQTAKILRVADTIRIAPWGDVTGGFSLERASSSRGTRRGFRKAQVVTILAQKLYS
jgi:hypothetical protein